MQFSKIALFAAAASVASASYPSYSNDTVVYTTEVVTAYTTYCPAATSVVVGGKTYTVTEATTLTISECPCTIVKPVTTSSVVAPTSAPVYVNHTTAAPTTYVATSVGTTSVKATSTPAPLPASSGNKAAALSGAGLAGLLGLAAYIL